MDHKLELEFDELEKAALPEPALSLNDNELLFCVALLRSRRTRNWDSDILLSLLQTHEHEFDTQEENVLESLNSSDPATIMLAAQGGMTDYHNVSAVLRQLATLIEKTADPMPLEAAPLEEVAEITKMLKDAEDKRELKRIARQDSEN